MAVWNEEKKVYDEASGGPEGSSSTAQWVECFSLSWFDFRHQVKEPNETCYRNWFDPHQSFNKRKKKSTTRAFNLTSPLLPPFHTPLSLRTPAPESKKEKASKPAAKKPTAPAPATTSSAPATKESPEETEDSDSSSDSSEDSSSDSDESEVESETDQIESTPPPVAAALPPASSKSKKSSTENETITTATPKKKSAGNTSIATPVAAETSKSETKSKKRKDKKDNEGSSAKKVSWSGGELFGGTDEILTVVFSFLSLYF